MYLLNEAGPVINSKTIRKYKSLEWVGQENMIYKSNYEERFAKFLKEEGIDFLYEPLIFRSGSLVYIPDFLVYNNPVAATKGSVFVEIKGLWENKAYDKVVLMQAQFPLLVMNRSILMEVTRK
jgi:predicted nuclease of restriction endonuclease-like RecB superfamily